MNELIWTPVKVRLGQIIKWEHNPRMSTKIQAQRLIKSERELGQIQTVAISPFDENGFCNLYDGHQRVSAWLTVKGADYEVNALQSNRHLTEDERKKVSVLLHTATGSWSWDALSSWSAADLNEWGMDKDTLKGWKEDTKELTDLLNSEETESVDAEPQIDRAEELLAKWQVKTGDLWKIGEHRLLCGDSSNEDDLIKLLGKDKVTLVFEDPPYGVEIGAKNRFLQEFDKSGRVLTDIKNDNITKDDLYNLLLKHYRVIQKFFSDSCSVFVCSPQGGELGMMMMMMMMDAGLEVRHVLNWVKNSPTFSMGRLDYDYQHEPILFTWKGKHKRYKNGEWQTSTWFVNKPMSNKEHPTMKPFELARNAILNHTDLEDVCFDGFGGSGSTMVAGQNTNRKTHLMELEPKYCSVILERMSTAFPELEIKRLNG